MAVKCPKHASGFKKRAVGLHRAYGGTCGNVEGRSPAGSGGILMRCPPRLHPRDVHLELPVSAGEEGVLP